MEREEIRLKEIIIVGSALFAMFFGAGNLIFPTSLGFLVGSNWMIGFLGFALTGVCLPLIAVIATTKAGGTLESVGAKVFPLFGKIFGVLLVVFVGIFFIIPRTGATTYEMAIRPLAPNFSPVIVSIIFFGLNIFFAINPSKVVERVGKILTPVLLVCLIIMIIKGVIVPIGKPIPNSLKGTSVFANGFINGYQTADALGGLIFAGIVVSSFIAKGFTDKKSQIVLTFKAAIVAIIGLFVIYFGLSYLGATVSGIYDGNIEKTTLLVNVINKLLGNSGLSVLGIIVAFACLSTAIGATSASASLIERASKNKIPYKYSIVIISIFSAVFAVKGVESLIVLAMPVLLISYPIAMSMIIPWLFYELLPNDGVFPGVVYVTIVICIIDTLGILGVNLGFLSNIVSMIPLANYGFAWVLPAILGGVVGAIIFQKKHSKAVNIEEEKVESNI